MKVTLDYTSQNPPIVVSGHAGWTIPEAITRNRNVSKLRSSFEILNTPLVGCGDGEYEQIGGPPKMEICPPTLVLGKNDPSEVDLDVPGSLVKAGLPNLI